MDGYNTSYAIWIILDSPELKCKPYMPIPHLAGISFYMNKECVAVLTMSYKKNDAVLDLVSSLTGNFILPELGL